MLILCPGIQLRAQQSEAEHKLFNDTKTKAEKGDADAQCAIGEVCAFGSRGFPKDTVGPPNGLVNLSIRDALRLNTV